ncbi:MAG: hypothetical protein E6G94_10410 [Alphaproteobacteria bacterium]|nr:MAG: hypothetical protein E6G94_10410 [Alphaproteobacteria bacterium]
MAPLASRRVGRIDEQDPLRPALRRRPRRLLGPRRPRTSAAARSGPGPQPRRQLRQGAGPPHDPSVERNGPAGRPNGPHPRQGRTRPDRPQDRDEPPRLNPNRIFPFPLSHLPPAAFLAQAG